MVRWHAQHVGFAALRCKAAALYAHDLSGLGIDLDSRLNGLVASWQERARRDDKEGR